MYEDGTNFTKIERQLNISSFQRLTIFFIFFVQDLIAPYSLIQKDLSNLSGPIIRFRLKQVNNKPEPLSYNTESKGWLKVVLRLEVAQLRPIQLCAP